MEASNQLGVPTPPAPSGGPSVRGPSRTGRPTAPAGSTSPGGSRPSRWIQARRTCSPAPPAAVCGRASIVARAGRRAPTTRHPHRGCDRLRPSSPRPSTAALAKATVVLGAGILRSTDGGTTWSPLCTAPFVGQGFYDLVVDPANSQHCLPARRAALRLHRRGRELDPAARATTWSLSMAPAGGARRRSSPRAATASSAPPTAARLDGRSAAWRAGVFDRLAVAIAVRTRRSPTPGAPAAARLTSGGARREPGPPWARRRASTPARPGTTGSSRSRPTATRRSTAAPSKSTAATSGHDWTWPNLTNKGATGDSIHPDQHAIAFEPGQPNTIYVGNDGGLYRSPDRGITWQHCNNGLVISEFEYLAHDYGSSRWLIGGTQDNGTQRWTGPQYGTMSQTATAATAASTARTRGPSSTRTTA